MLPSPRAAVTSFFKNPHEEKPAEAGFSLMRRAKAHARSDCTLAIVLLLVVPFGVALAVPAGAVALHVRADAAARRGRRAARACRCSARYATRYARHRAHSRDASRRGVLARLRVQTLRAAGVLRRG